MGAQPEVDNEILISRRFEAPREVVFQAWSDPQALEQWYAPQGCTIRFLKLEFWKGGELHSCIRTPSGYECWCVGKYLDIQRPERIVFTMASATAEGKRAEPQQLGMDPEWPAETVVTVTFAEEGCGTRLTLHQTVSEALAKKTGAYPSWLQMLDRLAEEVAGVPR